MNDLVFHNYYGQRSASAPINGEPDAFRAVIVKQDDGYRLALYTHNELLSVATFRTLAEARAFAQSSYVVVEGVNL